MSVFCLLPVCTDWSVAVVKQLRIICSSTVKVGVTRYFTVKLTDHSPTLQ